jgi:hypothetical protein
MRVSALVLIGIFLCACAAQEPAPPPTPQPSGPDATWRLGARMTGVQRAGAVYQPAAREHIATPSPTAASAETNGD